MGWVVMKTQEDWPEHLRLSLIMHGKGGGGNEQYWSYYIVLCFIHNCVKVGPCSKLKVIKVKTNQHSFKT